MDDFSELIDEWTAEHGTYFDGDAGVELLERFLSAIGYEPHGFKHGSIIEVFLSDNPGSIIAILDWIAEQNSPEWKDNLEAALSEGDDCD